MKLRLNNARMRRKIREEEEAFDLSDPFKVFAQFFEETQGRSMDAGEEAVLKNILEEEIL